MSDVSLPMLVDSPPANESFEASGRSRTAPSPPGPVARWIAGEVATARSMVGELIRYRELLASLTGREIRIRYKQSVLGVAWALFLPLAMMLIFTFVFTRAIDLRQSVDVSMPYPIFAYIGLLPWVFFATALTQAVNSLVGNASLLTKIYFPREIFPFASVASAMVDFLIGVAVLVLLIAYYHVAPDQCGGAAPGARGDWTFAPHLTLLAVPVVVLVQVLLTLGLALLLSMANLFYRDVRYVFTVAIQLWMFLTNVLYPLPDRDGTMRLLTHINPMTPIIAAYRDLIVHGRLPALEPSLYAVGVSVAVFLVGWRWFHAAEFRFAERV
jgi:lipopolysaccharide transport system permease protein